MSSSDAAPSAQAPSSGGLLGATDAIPKAVIKNADMEQPMQDAAIGIALDSLRQFSVEKDMAAHVKRAMDQQFGATWHAVVGRNYGSYVTHETKHFIYFYLGQIAFLLWRA
ncbi:hypothetical protein FA09DRAFT_298009 [Tilletiopsis washingtonensis]|uniref:Dynein light chain n=1 Tax=Tilletiopsis washingtonensis TaxID=58919 RepID=A0A316Z8D2_9BASI|nr:hypothetical protein FA09DRAFT_298009 [Tilletiopsis washingtonensis]PWN97516.1 hypothetical protein FA09DRAFT_298009 [Tilletiopsis washingtonensis]